LLAMLLTYKDRQQELGVPWLLQFAARQRGVWTAGDLLSPIIGAEGGGNLNTPNTRRDNLLRFKNVDGIGHPGAEGLRAPRAIGAHSRRGMAVLLFPLTLSRRSRRQGLRAQSALAANRLSPPDCCAALC